MKHFIAYLTVMLLAWAILAMLTVVVFNLLFTMHPSDAYYNLHHDYMSLIAYAMGVPAWCIASCVIGRIKSEE